MTPTDRLRNIDSKRTTLLDRAASLEPSRLTAHPRPGKWSILEIIEHMVIAEEDVLGDFATLDRREHRPRGLRNRLLYRLVMFILTHDIPVRAPSRAMIPSGDRSLAELRARWEENHRLLRRYVEALDEAGTKRAVFRHPVTGPITVSQALHMLEVHLDRHTRQIRALEALSAGSPAD